jgi:hypothetical protein
MTEKRIYEQEGAYIKATAQYGKLALLLMVMVGTVFKGWGEGSSVRQ